MAKKTALPFKHDPDMFKLEDGRNVSRSKALKEGYDVGAGSSDASENAEAYSSWRTAIICLPEARERQAAAAELIASRNHQSLSIEQARAFLRGLPSEIAHTDITEETMITNTDPKAARLAEIAGSMAAYNRNNGYNVKAPHASASDVDPARLKRLAEIRLGAMEATGRGRTQEARSLRLALNTHETVGTPLARVFAQLGVDTSKFLSSNV